ncbi:MAG: NAD(P)/FAD-dependent oxidoreductase [Candidatus Hodarchaeales archaeon]
MKNYYKIIIIGCGPAGIAAAIQLKRSGFDPLVLEKERIGGLLRNANLVENYPGFPGGITGEDLVNLFDDHLRHLGVKINRERVLQLKIPTTEEKDECSGNDINFVLRTADKTYYSTHVVIATGTRPKKPCIVFPPEIAERIYYEIVPLLTARDKKITIIGAGDAAFDYSLSLAKKNEILILNRSSKTKALALLAERIAENRKIRYLTENRPVNVHLDGSNRLKLTIEDSNGHQWFQTCDYLVYAIGREPEISFFTAEFTEQMGKLVNSNLIHIIGDVRGSYRQTAIAAGEGIRTAVKIAMMEQ